MHSKNNLIPHARLRLVVLIVLFTTIALLSGPRLFAGAPEYMQMKFVVGKAYEIEVIQTKTGSWMCKDIEELPKPREPKLRGTIESMNYGDSTATIFGVKVRFREHTEYLNDGAAKSSFALLKEGQRVELSCKLSETGEFLVRKVRVTSIKKNDKVKGNITRMVITGNPPDTLEVNGIKLLLVPETDIVKPQSYREATAEELFGALALPQPDLSTPGTRLGQIAVIRGDFRQTIRTRNEMDLSRRFQSDGSETEPYLRLAVSAYLHAQIRAMVQARLYKNYVISSDDDRSSAATKLELMQAYLVAPMLGNSGLAIQIGRQDFESPREWLFDDYLDAARLYFFGVAPLRLEVALIHAVEPLNPKFRTWTDLFSMLSVRFDKYSSFSAYVLARRDSDPRNREPIWWGAMYNARIRSQFRPWVNLSLMHGSDKDRPVRAYAFDVGAAYVATESEWTPSLSVSYAFASGDDGSSDGVDHAFRQTGYEDNVSRYGGLSKISLYGMVLNPELSNLKVVTLGAGCRPFETAALELFYHRYWQHRLDPDLQGSGLVDPPARPNGQSRDIGSAFDLVASSPEFAQRLRASWSVGVFNPGQAYSPRQKRAVMNRFEVTIKL